MDKKQKLVKCLRCGALYMPQEWLSGNYSNDTTDDFFVTGRIPKEHCPICRRPPKQKGEHEDER